MREIKFRVWDKEKQVMGSVAGIEWNPDWSVKRVLLVTSIESQGVADVWEQWVCGVRVNLMQFTGLKDRNGKEIFEGDLLKSEVGIVYQVVWDCEAAMYSADAKYATLDPPVWRFFSEVIGNIYENPELLEVAHE